MGFSYSTTDSGLVVAEQAMDEAAVRRALKEWDPDLRLVPQASEKLGTTLWKVMRTTGSDRPAEFVCAWQSDRGEPYPLSMRILDLVKQLDKNTRSSYQSVEERDARRRAELERETQQRNEDLADDWTPKHGRPVLPRSQSLRMSRDRRRARGEKV